MSNVSEDIGADNEELMVMTTELHFRTGRQLGMLEVKMFIFFPVCPSPRLSSPCKRCPLFACFSMRITTTPQFCLHASAHACIWMRVCVPVLETKSKQKQN